jgi:hypothetical protein
MLAVPPAPLVNVLAAPNMSRQVSDYAEELESVYDSMKLDRMGRRMIDMANSLIDGKRIAAQIEQLTETNALQGVVQKIKGICDVTALRNDLKGFKEQPKIEATVSHEPMIDLSAGGMSYT